MKSEEIPPSDHLHWTGKWYLTPVWPHEPDVGIIRSLAKEYLAAELPASLDETLMKVKFFAEGERNFNKLYEISYPGNHPGYLIRVAVPVEPYYKAKR